MSPDEFDAYLSGMDERYGYAEGSVDAGVTTEGDMYGSILVPNDDYDPNNDGGCVHCPAKHHTALRQQHIAQ
jgi:hypothetical protein